MSRNTRFLTGPQVAADLLGLHPESVRKMVRTGRLPAFKAGRSWRFNRSHLEEWFERQDPRFATGARVLVVDDAPQVRDVIRLTLEDAGYDVVLAETGEGAIASIQGNLPDLVLLDLRLPGASGVDVMAAIRRRSAALPVVVITGYPDSDLMHRALEHSPFVVMAKPVHPDTLLRTVGMSLDARPQRDTPENSAARNGA